MGNQVSFNISVSSTPDCRNSIGRASQWPSVPHVAWRLSVRLRSVTRRVIAPERRWIDTSGSGRASGQVRDRFRYRSRLAGLSDRKHSRKRGVRAGVEGVLYPCPNGEHNAGGALRLLAPLMKAAPRRVDEPSRSPLPAARSVRLCELYGDPERQWLFAPYHSDDPTIDTNRIRLPVRQPRQLHHHHVLPTLTSCWSMARASDGASTNRPITATRAPRKGEEPHRVRETCRPGGQPAARKCGVPGCAAPPGRRRGRTDASGESAPSTGTMAKCSASTMLRRQGEGIRPGVVRPILAGPGAEREEHLAVALRAGDR